MKTTTFFKSLILAACCPFLTNAQQTPTLLKDIATQGFFLSSSPTGFQRAGDNLYFFAASGGLYSNLFITDGTEAGTVEATIDEYSASFASLISMPFGNHMIVANSIGDNVYFSDGTATGEVAIIDDFDYTFDYGFNGKNSFTIGSNLYFWAARTADAEGGELYKTDGTAAGTGLFKAFNPGSAKGFTGSTIGQHHLLQRQRWWRKCIHNRRNT